MFGRLCTASLLAGLAAIGGGCTGGVLDPGSGNPPTAADVAGKALDIATQVGGPDGFGGSLMEGYVDHMPDEMGFYGVDDLAPQATDMMFTVRNESDLDGIFHLSYFASHMGLEEQVMDVEVAAGSEVTVEIPCAEIVGMGSLDEPGEVGCHLANGEPVDNRMTVPGFLGQDFTCDEAYECVLTRDVDDLDGDGDTDELIILSNALEFHIMNGGPAGHMHGTAPGMMASHMGF